jgi:opine dehydrogenase
MQVAVLGAGSTALANAWFLARGGHDVRIWSAIQSERSALAGAPGVSAEGIMNGTVAVSVAPDAESCLEGASLVIIAAPAFAHLPLMTAAAPHLKPHQEVMVHPVTGLSSLLLSRLLMARGVKPTIIDVSTSLFTARKTAAASVRILKLKTSVDVATIPNEVAADTIERLEGVFGKRFRREANTLAVSLNNHNPVYHVAPMLCNLSRVERHENWIIWECITPGVAKLIKLVDEERLAVVRHFGTREVSVDDYFRQAHGATGRDLNEIFHSVAERLKGPAGPQEFDHRFITEDVPYGLVFFRSLGQVARVEMPITTGLIGLASALYGRDFTAEGHTVARLRLDAMSSRDIMTITANGF